MSEILQTTIIGEALKNNALADKILSASIKHLLTAENDSLFYYYLKDLGIELVNDKLNQLERAMEFNLTFGEAIELAKSGAKIARKGWNGKNMFVAYSPGFKNLPAENVWGEALKDWVAQNGGTCDVLPYLILKTADNKVLIGWLASQTDMLSSDWGVIE